eukprot:SAG11_NODE_19362_length_468_cov_1.111111_1_plen_53_part_01
MREDDESWAHSKMRAVHAAGGRGLQRWVNFYHYYYWEGRLHGATGGGSRNISS